MTPTATIVRPAERTPPWPSAYLSYSCILSHVEYCLQKPDRLSDDYKKSLKKDNQVD